MSDVLIDVGVSDRKTVSIACSLRSGSNLLCEFLTKHGFGKPTEYFQDHLYRNYSNMHIDVGVEERSIHDLIKKFKRIHEGEIWYGVKWNWYSFHIFQNEAKSMHPNGVFDILPNIKWIRLGRQKRVRQAVSLYIAQNIGVWSYNDIPNLDREVIYSFDEIDKIVNSITQEENMWDHFFESHDIEPCRLYYEDLIKNPEIELQKVINYLGYPESKISEIDFDIRSNYHNVPVYSPKHEEFIKLYHADLGEEYRDRQHFSDYIGVAERIGVRGLRDETLYLLQDMEGRYPVVEKHRLDDVFSFEGSVERIEQDYFPDGVAFWLEDNAVATSQIECDAVVVSLLMHPWSGEVEITFDQQQFVFDLYSPIPSLKSFSHQWDGTKRRTIVVRPTGAQNPLASGSQVWIQRFWSRRCVVEQ